MTFGRSGVSTFSELNDNKKDGINDPHRSLIKRMILDYYYSLVYYDTNICDIIIHLLAT